MKQRSIKIYSRKRHFVAEEAILWKNQEVKDKMVKFVDLALEEALETGVEAEDFLEIVVQRVKKRKN